MKKRVLSLIVATILLVAAIPQIMWADAPEKGKIIAYLPNWIGKEWTVDDIDGDKLTHLLMSFARIDNNFSISNYDVRIKDVPDTVSSELLSEAAWDEVAKVQKKFPDLKMIIAVGGWGGEGFSDMAATAPTREIFVKSVVEYINKYNLDGIDLDWEYPVQGADGLIKSRPEDRDNFTELIKLLRKELGKDKEISFCANVSGWFFDVIDFDTVMPFVDSVNVMAYDFHGTWDNISYHHTNLYPSPNDPVVHWGLSSSEAIQRFLDAGVPANQVVLGMAAYGREFDNAAPGPNGDGLFQDYDGTVWRDGSIPFYFLKHYYVNKNGFKRYWDKDAKAPYLYDGRTFITYDDEESIMHKTLYAKDKGLGGVMYWEYVNDIEGDLLNVMHKHLNAK